MAKKKKKRSPAQRAAAKALVIWNKKKWGKLAKRKTKKKKGRRTTALARTKRWSKLGIQPPGWAFRETRGYRALANIPTWGAFRKLAKKELRLAMQRAHYEGRELSIGEAREILFAILGRMPTKAEAAALTQEAAGMKLLPSGGDRPPFAPLGQTIIPPSPFQQHYGGAAAAMQGKGSAIQAVTAQAQAVQAAAAGAAAGVIHATGAGAMKPPRKAKAPTMAERQTAMFEQLGLTKTGKKKGKKKNPEYFPRRGYKRGKLRWWIADVFKSKGQNTPSLTYIDRASRDEAAQGATRLVCEHKAHVVELSGPYASQPTPMTARK